MATTTSRRPRRAAAARTSRRSSRGGVSPRRLVPRIVGGDGGGLLLAFWVYPLVLATVQHGAAGPGMWLRAKFLNQDETASGMSGHVAPATPSGPSAPNPQLTYGGGGSTPMRIA